MTTAELARQIMQLIDDERAASIQYQMATQWRTRGKVLAKIQELCFREALKTTDEPSYTKDQSVWYDTGAGKMPATFIEYIGMTVQIQVHGSMYPQNVYISTISSHKEATQ